MHLYIIQITLLFNITMNKMYISDTTFTHLADTFMQIDLQMRTMESVKTNKRVIIYKCFDKSQLA